MLQKESIRETCDIKQKFNDYLKVFYNVFVNDSIEKSIKIYKSIFTVVQEYEKDIVKYTSKQNIHWNCVNSNILINCFGMNWSRVLKLVIDLNFILSQ